MIIGHGDDRYRYGTLVQYDFSSNVPYRHHADQILRFLSSRLNCLYHYPDPTAGELRELLGQRYALTPEHLLVTNGSTEAFYLLAHLFANRQTVITVPSFTEYEDACQLYRHQISYISTRSIRSYSQPTDLLWTALPNNPDGEISHREQILEYCTQHPNSSVIVDEAYAELCSKPVSLLCEISHHPNLIIVRSLTKSFALPGIRLGYIVAQPSLLQQLETLRHPWSVNALALEAGVYICQHYEALLPDASGLVAEAKALSRSLSELRRVSVIPSPTPYFLAKINRGSTAELKGYLITQHGILVRDAANFRSLTPQHFRLSVQSFDACQRLLKGLSQF